MFDFEKLYHEAYKVYKNIKEREPDIFQEIVAFTPGVGILKCGNLKIIWIKEELPDISV